MNQGRDYRNHPCENRALLQKYGSLVYSGGHSFLFVLQKEGQLTLRDLKNCKLSGNFFNILFNLNKFVAFETRDPFLIRQVFCPSVSKHRFLARGEQQVLRIARERYDVLTDFSLISCLLCLMSGHILMQFLNTAFLTQFCFMSDQKQSSSPH